ncbi:MAG: M23 family metallopeptidase [Bacteroidales bacterium]|nr:M23 family metallopeptidase [Bacteroidales bacterium]
MHNFSFSFLLAFFFINPALFAQSRINATVSSPVDIPILLSGNYGELRSTHFHAGIDIKTQQTEGKNVLAIDSGYVYRIAVQSGGYGKAVYLRHKNGRVSVYCHLNRFVPALEKYVKEAQYRKKSFEVDLAPHAGQFAFSKGALLGYSGNSGNSAGPHLHFEIRNAQGTVTFNPLNYGFPVKDNTSPEIRSLMICSLDPHGAINDTAKKIVVQAKGRNGKYALAPDTFRISGRFGIGVETYDFLDNSPNECGPYTIRLQIDNRTLFFCRIDSIAFSSQGYINSHVDYEEKMISGRKIQKLYLDPNNQLNIYKVVVNRGIIRLSDQEVHPAVITVRDTYGNESVLKFYVRQQQAAGSKAVRTGEQQITRKFYYDSLNVYENHDIRVAIPKGALFDNMGFTYEKIEDTVMYASLHKVHNEFTPLYKNYMLSVRAREIPKNLYEKLLLVSKSKDGSWMSQGGEFKNGFVTARVRSFGCFSIAVDTMKPEIKPKSFVPGGRYSGNQVISFTISDTLSGIRKYAGYIDKQWALFEYDAKNQLFSYTIDSSRLAKSGLHTLEIYVTDNKDNVTRYLSDFHY